MAKKEFVCDCNMIHEESVYQAKKKMPKEEIFDKVAIFFKLLGDQTRVKILFALDQHEMCVCDLANTLSMTKSSISHQLSHLRKEEIVKCRKEGKEVYYTLDDEHVRKVFEIALEHIQHKKEEKNEKTRD